MAAKEKIYVFLCTLFSVLLITGNLIYQKFVHFSVFELSAGALSYPCTFLLTDLISEFYGKDRAKFCVKLGIVVSICVAIILALINNLDATNWSKISNEEFDKIFGLYNIAFLGSMVANYISQVIDINIYLWIRKLTKGKFLWIRSNLSSGVSLLIDTTIVISFMVVFKIIPLEQFFTLTFNSYGFKIMFILSSTPLFYLGVYLIKSLIIRLDHSTILANQVEMLNRSNQ